MNALPLRGMGEGSTTIARALRPICLLAAALVTTSVLLPHTGHTQPTDDASWQLEEVLVIGDADDTYQSDGASVLRSDVPLIDWPQSVQVLNRTLLDEQRLTTLTEALVNVSGVIPNNEQETVLVNPFIRGLEAEIYLDGLIGYGDTAVIDPSSLAIVERVEVAKGPTSTLFGGGVGAPTGGLINLVTKTPRDEAFRDLSLRGGSFDTLAAAADLNQPLSDSVGVRFAGEYFQSDDMIDAVEIERLTLNPSLRWAPGEDTTVLVRGVYNRIEQIEYTGLPAEVIDLPGVDPRQFSGAINGPPTEITNSSVHLSVDHSFSSSLSVQAQVRRFENEFDEFSSFPFLGFFPIEGTAVPIIRGQLPVDTTEWTGDVSLAWRTRTGGVEHNVLVGITVDATDYAAGSGFDFTPIGVLDYASGVNTLDFGAIPELNAFNENEYRTQAFYLQDQLLIGERWRLLASARVSRYGLEELVGGSGVDETYTEVDPRVGITFKATEAVSLFAGFATGSRIVPFFAGVNAAPPVPETSESYEMGVKFAFEKLSGTIAAFILDRENIPITDLTDPFFGSTQEGAQRSEGVEFDLVYEPIPQLSILASGAYIDARNQTDIVSFGTIFAEGNELSRVPHTSARLAARYRVTQGALRGLGVGLGVTYADEAPLTDANDFFSDEYTVLDMQADYAITDNITLSANVINLFDREYFKPYQYLLQPVARLGQERSAFINLGVSF
ncbi:MAG: TonB-dependent siderophore receptor [Pseudomonadota bacterium]